MGVNPRATEAVVRPVAARLPGIVETRRGEFRCPVVASGGLCKIVCLSKAIKLLMWLIF